MEIMIKTRNCVNVPEPAPGQCRFKGDVYVIIKEKGSMPVGSTQ